MVKLTFGVVGYATMTDHGRQSSQDVCLEVSTGLVTLDGLTLLLLVYKLSFFMDVGDSVGAVLDRNWLSL